MRSTPRVLVGLALAGYGLLVLLRVLPHDAPAAGGASLALGLAFLVPGLPRVDLVRGRLVAAVGATMVLGVLAYNAVRGSDLSVPEWGLLGYGLALLAAAPFLARRIARTDVASLVGWSFPLLLAPLLLFAVNATLSSAQTGAAAAPLIVALIVHPTAAALNLIGTGVTVLGSNLILPTERGSLTLGVGLVCAGLYPMVLFGGLVGVYAWRERVPWRRCALLMVVGLVGLWLVNLVRLILLAKVGQRWGAEALQQAHANLGWVLFAAYMVVFWAIVLRRTKPSTPWPDPAPAS